tara:strand:- start:689 stop:904 length:216 start_codon:yes stop_codon:yes gene_type:complete
MAHIPMTQHDRTVAIDTHNSEDLDYIGEVFAKLPHLKSNGSVSNYTITPTHVFISFQKERPSFWKRVFGRV